MPHQEQAEWRRNIARFEKPHMTSSVWQLINTLAPFVALWYLSYWSLSISYWLALVPAIVAGGFLVRTFIIFHDCCHRSFFRSKSANAIVGTLTGIMTFCPYDQWRHSHSVHHATSGNLDRRGTGDIWTLTVDEYIALPLLQRIRYRIYRNPFVMFVLGPIYIFLLDYRFNRKGAGRKERINTYITNLGIAAAIALLCWAIGWQSFLLIQGTIFIVSGMAGIWLFYVQHQFEDSYYENEEEWNFVQAALQGSSFYKLPRVLHWITGNIGFHHIHHLSPRVPNYHLEKVHNQNPMLQKVHTMTLLSSFRSLFFQMWNVRSKKLVGFRHLRSLASENRK